MTTSPQTQKELDKLEDQLSSMPAGARESRTKIAETAKVVAENSDLGIKESWPALVDYAEERAYYFEGSTASLDLWDINASAWTGESTDFTFPSASTFVAYGVDTTGADIVLDPASHYFIIKEGGLAGERDIDVIMDPANTGTQVDFTVMTITVDGVDHQVVTLNTSLTEAPSINDTCVVFNKTDNSNAGTITIGIEGQTENLQWDPLENVDLSNQSEFDAWYSSMMEVGFGAFVALAGPFADGSIDDDISKSANPQRTSRAVRPDYPKSELYKSPFFPAYTSNEDDRPEELENLDLVNRVEVVDDAPVWGVYPLFRWQGKLIPDLSQSPKEEKYPRALLLEGFDFVRNTSVSQTGFPVNDLATETTYYWDQASDKVIETEVGEYACTYNSLSSIINDSNVQAGFQGLEKAATHLTGWVSPAGDSAETQAAEDFLPIIEELDSAWKDVLNHHDSWFSSADDGDTTKFDTSLGTYDQSFLDALITVINNRETDFMNRIQHLEEKIGSPVDRTGYSGSAFTDAELMTHKNFGMLRSLKSAVNGINSIKENLKRTKQKYNAFNR